MKYEDAIVLHEQDNYRILEILDRYADLNNLKGDSYNPEVNPDIDIIELERQERDFEAHCAYAGVYGYVLEKWNPEVGKGYEHVDSCWGFIGTYRKDNPDFNHYIVDELKSQIENLK